MSVAEPAARAGALLAPEDQARANLYGLLARLLHAAPDAALLRALAGSEQLPAESETPLTVAWRQLMEAALAANADDVREEFERVFVGTGKAEVTPYTGAYLMRSSVDSPLAELRGDLAARGLARRGDINEPEDHLGALCDAMRHLIAEQQVPIDDQQRFFERWIRRPAIPLCDAIENSPNTDFYKRVGRLARIFFELEQAAFEMQ